MNVDNILTVYASATPEEREQGATWYHAAHTFCVGLSRRYSDLGHAFKLADDHNDEEHSHPSAES